ncbi:MAG: 2Fe-2S iron-sulfur cluster-binding protein [Myxococcota bacterium]
MDPHRIQVIRGPDRAELTVAHGRTLREALLEAGLSPYARATRTLNCGGNGLCATCGVWVEPEPEPTHWHDRAAARWGYPRLSCQIRVDQPMLVRLIPDKRIWGARRSVFKR